MRGRPLTDAERETLRHDARGLSPDAPLRRWCEEQAELLGCSPSTIYRAVRDERPTRRSRRSDAGTSRILTQRQLDDLGALVVQYDYDAELAIDSYNASRVQAGEPEVDVHPETLRRHLRRMGVSRRHNAQDLRVHRRWEAPYPGYLWQIDSTVAESWWIDQDDTVGYEAPVQRNKTKAGNGKPRIWLIGAIDDCSRVRWARFYSSNAAAAWRDLLLRAMRGFAPAQDWPAFGIPERIYSDQDSAMKSALMTDTLRMLEVERTLALPSTEQETNAQAKGKVERMLGLILQGFEKTLRGRRVTRLSELNRLLLQHLTFVNNRRHSETRVAPFERWLSAPEVRLLPDPERLRRALRRRVERVVQPDITIKLEGRVYQLPRRAPFVDLIRQRVPVLYFEADLAKISIVVDGAEHEIAAVEAVPDVAGEFKKAETPAAVKKKRELQQRDVSHIDPHAVHDYRVERDRRSYPIRPPTTHHEIPEAEIGSPVQVRLGKAIDLAQRAGVVAAPPSELERQALKALFDGRREIPETELRAWIRARHEAGPSTRATAEGA